MNSFIDSYGATLTTKSAAQNHVTITITDGTTVSITIAPGMVLATSRQVILATRLSEQELHKARAGKKLKLNKYTRLGEAEAPSGTHRDKLTGTEILVYPDRGNHVLIEMTTFMDSVSFLLPPGKALDLMHAMRLATGLTGKDLAFAAVKEGLISPEPPTERHELHRHNQLMKENKGYAEVITRLERGRVSVPGSSFMKATA